MLNVKYIINLPNIFFLQTSETIILFTNKNNQLYVNIINNQALHILLIAKHPQCLGDE